MTDRKIRTTLVTGASSGLGLEAAAQLAAAGYARVVITARTDDKAESARAEIQTSGAAGFETLTLDLDDLTSVARAADVLAERGGQIDVLLLNAGIVSSNEVKRTTDNIEVTAAATLTGHHAFTMRLLEAGLLADDARIILAGSEAARGDFPLLNPIDIDEVAAGEFNGDLEAAIEAVIRMEHPLEFNANTQYATVKMFAVWWARELAERLRPGMTVNVVSPGFIDTDMTRELDEAQRETLMVGIPMARLGQGQDIAEAVAFLASEGAGYITGQTLHVNGGMFMN